AGLPRAVDEVLARGLARAPEERFPSCEAFGAALARSVTPAAALVTPIVEVEGGSAARTAQELPRERSLGQVLLGAGVVVTTAALLLWAALRSSQAAPEPATAATTAPSAVAAPPPLRPRHPALRPARPHVEPTAVPSASTSSAAGAASDAGAPVPAPP